MTILPQQTALLQTRLLANEILTRFKRTSAGHCARVDFLERDEATEICRYIKSQHDHAPDIHILTSDAELARRDPLFITTDRAIEMRNRKEGRLCLFVPSDSADAAYSSIANAFEQIDGSKLHYTVLKRVQHQIAQLSIEAATTVRAVFSRLRGLFGIGDERRLDFAIAALERIQKGESAQIGLELWRVGLIADARESFASFLENNRHCTLLLASPGKLDATPLERIQSLKVDRATEAALSTFFRGRAMNDVRAWSRDLIAANLTFDTWNFPEKERSDIREVKITPFLNAKSEVEPYCKLSQPDGARGSLRACYGEKNTLVVRWKCDPPKPQNLDSWHIGILPVNSEPGFENCIEESYIKGIRRSATIRLNMEFDEPPDGAFCVRIAPLASGNSEIVDKATGQPLYADSQEFFLVPDSEAPLPPASRKKLETVPTLALGRLQVALETKYTVLEETEPQWQSRDLEYFSLNINDKRRLNLALSSVLLQLERRVLDEPRRGGCFVLTVDDVRPTAIEDIVPYALPEGDHELWAPFWRQRELFFKRLKQSEGRSVIEAVDWTPELAGAALRYAQAYRELIDALIAARVESAELLAALSIDSLLITVTNYNRQAEESLLILPTHPLRAAWIASYTQLLRKWENDLLDLKQQKRKQNVDLKALRLLAPTNVPPFAYHAASAKTFTFFQNLLFFHGIALAADVPDPHRRYGDIATILRANSELAEIGDIQPDYLADHLKMFQDMHPYADTLVTTLINPDRGSLFAEALRKLLAAGANDGEEDEDAQLPLFQITSYCEDQYSGALQTLARSLQPAGQRYKRATDQFLPGLVTTLRHMQELEQDQEDPPEAHVAIVTDFTRPTIVAAPLEQGTAQTGGDISSFALYGLITRFISQFTTDEEGLIWRHRIVTEGVRRPEPHPAGPRYSETLIELHTALLNAGGYLLDDGSDVAPMLQVRLSQQRRDLLERLHVRTNWVITLDRFFTLDYYDSPNTPGLGDVARKYVLDYAPEFTEGLGHRMMVTTAWHEEIGSLLSQAMDDLGFASVDQSVSHLLHYLKTISGRLALQAMESPSSAAAAVGLGVVTAWLQSRGRLRQAVLLPVDMFPRLFSLEGSGRPEKGERRCDLVLISLRRNIVDATFIEVKWRRSHAPLEGLAAEMVLQMKMSEQAMRRRCFNEEQIDGALQRSYLANVLRFYFERSRRYQLFDPAAELSFLEHVARLEKTGLGLKASYEGYVVSLDDEPRKPLLIDDARITVLTARDFAGYPQFLPLLDAEAMDDEIEWARHTTRLLDDDVTEVQRAIQVQEPAPAEYEQRREEPSGVDPAEAILDDDVAVSLGVAASGPVEWHPSVKGSPHLFILGIPGQGKSWTTTRILMELGRQQVPALVLDFHGQFADLDGPYYRALHPTVLDAAKGLPFSPFECATGNGAGGWKVNAMAVAEIFANVANLGHIQRDIVYTTIRDAYEAHGFDDGLAEVLPRHLTYPTLAEVFGSIERKEQERHIGNVTARCRPLLEMDLFRPAENAPDLFSHIRSGLVIDLHSLDVELLQLTAGAFILRKLYKDMFHWGYANRLRLALVLDEAHRLAKDVTLPKIMKEGRKFGIAVIVASQGLNDFHPDIVNNVGTKIIFRMNHSESRKAAGFIRVGQGQDLAARIEDLAVGRAYVQTPEMKLGALVHMDSL